MTVTHEIVADIPVFDVDWMPSADLCRRNLARVRSLVDEALSRRSHLLLPVAIHLIDRLSHSWLARQANPYLEEIRQVALTVGRPGAYFLPRMTLATTANARRGLKLNPCNPPASFEQSVRRLWPLQGRPNWTVTGGVRLGRWRGNHLLAPDE